MPLFNAELNELADRIKRSNLTLFLHTSAPSDADTDNGRVTGGGTGFTNGQAVATSNISRDADGDLTITADVNFGTASGNVGALTHWSLFRGTSPVAYGTLANVTVNDTDTFKVNANTLKINGTTS